MPRVHFCRKPRHINYLQTPKRRREDPQSSSRTKVGLPSLPK
jgi:hypothetical protein